ncbi:MAG: hypothetical protein ACM32E_21010 [Gemmatimonadota bacterium]
MTTEYDLDEILRRAMHAAVDHVEPAGDGLQQIRRQLTRPRLRLQAALLITETADLIRLIGIRLEPAAAWLLGLLRREWARAAAAVRRPAEVPAGPASGRPRHGPAHRSQPPGPMAATIAWLRPAVAVAAAVVIVVAGVFTLYTLRQTVSPISLLTGGGQSPAAGVPAGTGSRQSGAPHATASSPGSSPHASGKTARHHAAPLPSCTPGATAGPPVTPPTPTAAPSPTDTSTAGPTPTDTIAPSPADTSTSGTALPAGGVGAGGGPVQLTGGCYGAKKAANPAASPTP